MLPEHFARARPVDGHPTVDALPKRRRRARRRAADQRLRAGRTARRSTRWSSSTPTAPSLGTYRKSHIPDGPGYTEKYYFNPGDTGFRVWRHAARHDRRGHLLGPVVPGVGAGAWRCSAPRCCCYPTAIGSEPPDPTWDSSGHWQRVMQGHAGANLTPLVAANRVGHEVGQRRREITFYGSSFIADATGAKVAEAGRDGEAVLTATFDLDARAPRRALVGPVPRPPTRPVRAAADARRRHHAAS